MRAIAVLLVIFDHSGIQWMPGGLGVLIFFVISGFLITWLLLKENDRTGTVSLKSFYARRSLRIFPAFYSYTLLLLLLLAIFHKTINWPQTWAALLYFNNYFQAIHGDPGTGLSHTWSLGIEEQFYLFWPLLFIALCNRPKLALKVTALIIGTVWIYRILLKLVFHVWQGYFYEAFDTRMDHLLVGCLLAFGLFHYRSARIWTIICGRPLVTVSMVAALILSAAAEYRWADLYRDTFGAIVNPLLCALLIPQLIVFRSSALVQWLEWKPIRYLGTISYSLYLYQQLMLDPVKKLLHAIPFPLELATSVLLLIGVASFSYWFIEKPFLRFKDSRFQSSRLVETPFLVQFKY